MDAKSKGLIAVAILGMAIAGCGQPVDENRAFELIVYSENDEFYRFVDDIPGLSDEEKAVVRSACVRVEQEHPGVKEPLVMVPSGRSGTGYEAQLFTPYVELGLRLRRVRDALGS